MPTQRFESSVIAVSWIPSEAITGPSKIPFEFGVTHQVRAAGLARSPGATSSSYMRFLAHVDACCETLQT